MPVGVQTPWSRSGPRLTRAAGPARRHPSRRGPAQLGVVLSIVRQVLASAEATRWLACVHVPVELVAGADDPVTDLGYLRQLAEQLPYVTLTIRDGADHDLPLTDPTDAVGVITRAVDVFKRLRAADDPKSGSVADTDDEARRPGHHGGH